MPPLPTQNLKPIVANSSNFRYTAAMQVNAKVIDTSHFDNVETSGTDWTGFAKVYAAGYRGVINKVTQGRGMVDTSYARRRGPALTNGLLFGGYHYFTTEDPVQQANHFLASAQIDDKTLMALDHETRGVSLANARIFMETVKTQTGRYPWLYSGFLIKEQLGNTIDPFWQQIKLWLSHYNPNPTWPPCWTAPTLWQFTGSIDEHTVAGPPPHQVPGIDIQPGCDINSFDGTDDELTAIWAT